MQSETEVWLETGDVQVRDGTRKTEGEAAPALDGKLGGTGVRLEQGCGEEQAREEGLQLVDDEGGGLQSAHVHVHIESLEAMAAAHNNVSLKLELGDLGKSRARKAKRQLDVALGSSVRSVRLRGLWLAVSSLGALDGGAPLEASGGEAQAETSSEASLGLDFGRLCAHGGSGAAEGVLLIGANTRERHLELAG